jgi:RNA polymerase-binding transcription factor DksA
MTSTQKEMQRRLQIERQVLLVQLHNAQVQEMSGTASAVAIQMHGRLRVRLDSIERAIARLEKGSFGVCQSCGDEIQSERLTALPYTEQCIDCQRKLERKIIHQHAYSARSQKQTKNISNPKETIQ